MTFIEMHKFWNDSDSDRNYNFRDLSKKWISIMPLLAKSVNIDEYEFHKSHYHIMRMTSIEKVIHVKFHFNDDCLKISIDQKFKLLFETEDADIKTAVNRFGEFWKETKL